MTTRLVLSSIAFSLSLVACGSPADPVEHTPDAAPMPAPFDVTVATPKLPILSGASVTVEVTVARHAPFTGDVTISFENLPTGVSVSSTTIAADATTATLTLDSVQGAPHSLPTTVDVVGTAGGDRAQTTATVTVYGPPGSVDTSFLGGTQLLPMSAGDDYAFATAVQPDGKILLAGRSADRGGDFAIIRLLRDGEIDATFGSGGKVTTDFGGAADTIRGIALQPDGKIVAVGTTTSIATSLDFAVARYLPDGALDNSFSGDGKQMTVVGPDSDNAYAVAIQPDGKIVVGGSSNRGTSSTGVDFALVRYMTDGSLDTTFGGDTGMVFTVVGDNAATDSIYALALQTIGGETRIVAVGGEGDFSIARYRADGGLDTSFAETGLISHVYTSVIGAARAVAISPQGDIIVAGHSHEDFALIKLSKTGQLDPTFGRTRTAVSTTNADEATAVALDGDKVLVAGWVHEGLSTSGNFALLRYSTDGELDHTFAGGIVVTPVVGTKPDEATAMALQVDDRVPTVRVIVAGYASASNSDFAVARYWR